MPESARAEKMTITLSKPEREIREALEDHYGIDGAGVMRMGLLELGREAGITFDTVASKKKNAPKRER